MTCMYFIYSLLLGLALFILLPRFLIDAFRHGKYVAGFRERLGSLAPIQSHGRPVVWLHSVSVGETQAARPLVKGIRERFPGHAIAVSTITLTGQKLAREVFQHDVEKVFYFPFDWRWVVRRTLKAINPAAVLIMETELWPNFLRECGAREIPVAIVNGRLSGQSFRRYRFIKPLMRRIFKSISVAAVQTEADAERFRALGMDANKIFVSGNMKFDAGAMPANDLLNAEFRERFALGEGSPLILAASTHAPEEVIILNAFRQVLSESKTKPRLMIAPRHPERFAEVADLLNASGFRWSRRSAPPDADDRQAEVVLLDSIGELQSIYSLAPIVFVGGSIARTGGQNILEPAAVGAAVITGSHTYNFQLIVETFVKANAIIQLQPMPDSASITELANAILNLLVHPEKQRALGERARILVNVNRGATEHTLDLLSSILSAPSVAADSVTSLRVQGASSASTQPRQ